MKKINLMFLGECVIIVALLLLIGSLLKENPTVALGKEKEDYGLSNEAQQESGKQAENVQYAKDILEQRMGQDISGNDETVSGNSVSENQTLQTDEEIKIVVFGDIIYQLVSSQTDLLPFQRIECYCNSHLSQENIRIYL